MGREGRIDLLTCDTQLEEIRDVCRRPRVRALLRSVYVGTLVNELRRLASRIEPAAQIQDSPDPNGDFLLGPAMAEEADFLVSGDKAGLLSVGRYSRTRICTVVDLLAKLAR